MKHNPYVYFRKTSELNFWTHGNETHDLLIYDYYRQHVVSEKVERLVIQNGFKCYWTSDYVDTFNEQTSKRMDEHFVNKVILEHEMKNHITE